MGTDTEDERGEPGKGAVMSNTSKLIERLRKADAEDEVRGDPSGWGNSLYFEAATEIQELREALKPFADYYDSRDDHLPNDYVLRQCGDASLVLGDIRRARAKLEGGSDV